MTTQRIIVGVDGSIGARTALEWAVDECRLRSCTLLVVHAREHHPEAAGSDLSDYDVVAERLLTEHAAAASARRPSVPVTTMLGAGLPADTLIELSVDAELVVVGTRGSNGFTSTMLGSVSVRTAGHAHCPVTVVPQRVPPVGDEGSNGDVVVGICDDRGGRLALEFARQEAQLRGAHLRCVATSAEPAEAMLGAAQGAALLVLGCHHSDDRWGSRLGALATSILHRAPCPVVAVSELPQIIARNVGHAAAQR
ncbi:MAG: universal stress protein [Actinomycetota bacterium]|nr:universal stress protein [Actinomycetota bacterium]